MSTVQEIEKAIERLPAGEMLELARWLDARLRARMESDEDDEDDGALSPAWRDELDARVRRRESGETTVWSQEEVHARIRTLLS